MKKITAILAMILMVTLVTGCDKDEKIEIDQLPPSGQAFLDDHFGASTVLSLRKDKKGQSGVEYEARLDNGIEVTFDQNGLWQEVDAPKNTSLPTSFILPSIVSYITAKYPNIDINNIDREPRGFDVELINEVDLTFDTEGNFLGIDR